MFFLQGVLIDLQTKLYRIFVRFFSVSYFEYPSSFQVKYPFFKWVLISMYVLWVLRMYSEKSRPTQGFQFSSRDVMWLKSLQLSSIGYTWKGFIWIPYLQLVPSELFCVINLKGRLDLGPKSSVRQFKLAMPETELNF